MPVSVHFGHYFPTGDVLDLRDVSLLLFTLIHKQNKIQNLLYCVGGEEEEAKERMNYHCLVS